jgi:cell shape-determining protein MreC
MKNLRKEIAELRKENELLKDDLDFEKRRTSYLIKRLNDVIYSNTLKDDMSYEDARLILHDLFAIVE